MKSVCSNQCEKAFEELKAMLQSAPVSTAPDFSSSFKFAVDVVSFGKVPEHFVNTYIYKDSLM